VIASAAGDQQRQATGTSPTADLFDLLLCGVVILEAKLGAHFDGGNLKFKADY
jgi:hypothetical protein